MLLNINKTNYINKNYFLKMGIKKKIKKIKKMKYKKEEMKELETMEESSDNDALMKNTIIDNLYRPPYNVILDTNFINDCVRKKIDVKDILMEALNANVNIYVTECVFAELENLGRTYRIALNMIKKIEHTRLVCDHKGNYADNCILNRVMMNKIFFVATSDVNLKQRIIKKAKTPILIFRGRKLYSENFHGV